MSQSQGPWHSPPPDQPKAPRYRFLIWIALVAAGWFGLWELAKMFPDSHPDSMDQGYFVRNVAILALVASGVVYGNRFRFKESVRNIAIWMGVFAVILLGYAYYPQIEDAIGNARSELVPGYPVNTGKGEMVFSKDRNDEFLVIGSANGTSVKFLVDTGASEIVLSPEDAARIGIDTSRLVFDRTTETANGVGHGAASMLDTLQVGDMKLFNVPVSVNRTGMRNSLLGMAFLSRMKSFEFRGRNLYLRWR
jgi:aspartyl protease family protein